MAQFTTYYYVYDKVQRKIKMQYHNSFYIKNTDITLFCKLLVYLKREEVITAILSKVAR